MLAEQIKPSTPPTAYVVIQHSQECCHCFRKHNSSEVWARYDDGPRARRFVVIHRPIEIMWDVPIEQEIKLEKIPFCHECYREVTLGHLRTPPKRVELKTPLHTPGREEQRPKGAATAPRSATKRVCTVDDL